MHTTGCVKRRAERTACRVFCALFLATGLIGMGTSAFGQQKKETEKPGKAARKPEEASSAGKGLQIQTAETQQEAADSILGDVLDQISVQLDRHGHKGEFNHYIGLSALIVQMDPHNVEAFATPAWLLWSTDRNEEAVALLKKGIAANPDTYYMYDELGSHYLLHLKDPAGALPYCQKAVQFPCPFTTWHNLAFCYEKTNQWDKAAETWQSALNFVKDRDSHDVAQRQLDRARAKLAQQNNSKGPDKSAGDGSKP